MYNPGGRPIDQVDFGGPYDFAYATSLFSHLDPDVCVAYLTEIRRALRTGGRFVSTWYLYDERTLQADRRYRISHDFGHFRRESLSNPALVVAYDQDWLLRLYASAGFADVEVREGIWRGGKYAGQDVVIAS